MLVVDLDILASLARKRGTSACTRVSENAVEFQDRPVWAASITLIAVPFLALSAVHERTC